MYRLLTVLLLCMLPCVPGHGPALAAKSERPACVTSMPLNLNEATTEQLDELPGIGPALADRIIAYRDEHGPFTQLDQLSEIRGIGPRTLERLRPCLVVE